jgi:hypothetical protein
MMSEDATSLERELSIEALPPLVDQSVLDQLGD